jgi:hypothetical protein
MLLVLGIISIVIQVLLNVASRGSKQPAPKIIHDESLKILAGDLFDALEIAEPILRRRGYSDAAMKSWIVLQAARQQGFGKRSTNA